MTTTTHNKIEHPPFTIGSMWRWAMDILFWTTKITGITSYTEERSGYRITITRVGSFVDNEE